MYIKYIIILINIFNIMLFGCSTRPNITIPQQPYSSIKQTKKTNNTKNIINLNKLNETCSNIECEQQLQLDLIYYYYNNTDLKQAQQIANQFLHSYPNNHNLDYVYYIKGLINLSLDKNQNNMLHKLFNIHLSQYNPTYAYAAMHDLSHITKTYPTSQYYTKANEHIFYLENRITEYELNVIKFYYKKKAYTTVINRAQNILNSFPNTPSAHQALTYLNKAYQKLNLIKNKK
ncbi:outer membrane protein assembly factor BamD [Blochmannia endosymbiont of Camponotus (Colobopsis) obliquus]|uniref:outer membrane protein assembly factor BamD n=1 Tax=Blochmannia endosymbiont of Camponotus (Colobopsis) obliquus TaxID=1505597 RepID=UPI00061A578D|nr:outer membrane protein assembly factor BamD [Blochmannia endosymbiont of Camponotus (Colobopsis) obliquus]AKC60354.1 Outer membrane protein assembly factor BamD [Blochmannia endosymbiont of Camponotus (Colobopsis) obliquus]